MSRWLEIVKLVVPFVVTAVNPALAPLAPVIIHGISEAEALKGSQSGPEKRAHVLTLVDSGAVAANVVAGKTVIDPAQATIAAGTVIDATVAVTNLVHAIPPPTPAP